MEKLIKTSAVLSCFLAIAFSILAGCATTKKHTTHVAKKKRHHTATPQESYGLYQSNTDVNNRLLQRGQKTMGSSAMGQF